MATLQVRQRGERGSIGTLPQVKSVDYSGIGNNAMTQFQARGGIGSYVQDAVRNLANGIGSTVETLNARDERDASIQAEAFRSELTRIKEDFLREMQTNPTSADDAVQRWNAKVNEVRGKFAKDIGADGSYKRDCFTRVTQPFLDNSYVELFRASNKVSDAFNQKTADTTLKLLMEDVVNTSPDRRGDAMQMVANQALVSADAHHLSAEEREEKWRETRETVALMCANRAIANAASVSDLDKVNEAVTNVGVDGATHEQQETLNSVFGGIDYNALTPETRVKLQDAIRRKRSLLLQQQTDEVKRLRNQYMEGKIGLNDLMSARDSFYDNKGKPLIGESAIKEVNDLIATAQTKQDNADVENFMVQVVEGNPTNEDLDVMAKALPEHLRKDLRVVNFISNAKTGNAKAAWDAEQQRRTIALDKVKYNSGGILESVDERKAKLQDMYARGEITGDQLKAALKTIDVETNTRTRDVALAAIKMADGELWNADTYLRFDNDGFDMRGSYTSLKGMVEDETMRQTFVKTFDEYYTTWVDMVNQNPSWTPEECKKSFFSVMDPVLKAYGSKTLEFKGKAWVNARSTLTNLRALNTLSKGEKRKGMDHSVDAIGKPATQAEFRPIGGNRPKQNERK